MTLQLTSIGGRYPFRLAPYTPANVRATIQVSGDRVLIRIDDIEMIDRWEELTVSHAELLALLSAPVGRDEATS